MDVIFDDVTGDVRDERAASGGGGGGAASASPPAESDEEKRAKLRAALRQMVRREARLKAT